MARLLNTTFSSYNRPLIGFMEAELQRSLKRSLWYIIVYSLSAVAPPAGGRGGLPRSAKQKRRKREHGNQRSIGHVHILFFPIVTIKR